MDAEIAPIFHLVVKPSLQSFKQSPQPSSSNAQPSIDNVNIGTSVPLTAPSAPPTLPPQPFTFENNNTNMYVPAYPSVLPGGYQVVAIK